MLGATHPQSPHMKMRLFVCLIHDNPEDVIRNKVVGTGVKDYGLHGIHGFGMFTTTNGVMLTVYKATDEISCCLGALTTRSVCRIAINLPLGQMKTILETLWFHWKSRKLSQPN